MKLLPLACFAASAAQSGDYDYGAPVEEDRGYDYSSSSNAGYGNYDDYGNKKKNKYQNTWSFGGKGIGSHQSIAVALNCWPANFDYDKLMIQDTTATNPKENHLFGPLHLYGSEMHSRYASEAGGIEFTSEDPGKRASLGGHYHYGHAHHDETHNTEPSEWVHYHSARHAGCLYEAPDFSYNSNTWNRVWHLWYFNGYYDRNNKGTSIDANLDGVVYDPNWVHFFNAHVLVSGGKGLSTNPSNQADTNSIKLVMANPQYEGLGWLNFVATYGVSGVPVGHGYEEFADSTHVTTMGDLSGTYDTYTAINNAGVVQQTQGTTGNYYFDAWMGTWELNMDDAVTWTTLYDEVTPTNGGGTTFTIDQGLAISSFPHNELGKDFRFNLRVLLADNSNNNRQMYYFYKINTITITFPHFVSYALVYDGRESNTNHNIPHDGNISLTGSNANGQGEGIVNVAHNNVRDNIIPPLDLGSWYDYSFGAHTPSTDLHHRIQGYLSTDAADVCTVPCTNAADFCRTPSTNCLIDSPTCQASNFEEICSKKFRITGLLNTYSERHGGQRGTYQEIWIQLQYAIGNDDLNANYNPLLGSSPDIISSPFPYLHFMAYEIVDIAFECDTTLTNVDNGNTCDAFEEYGTHDFGFGGR